MQGFAITTPPTVFMQSSWHSVFRTILRFFIARKKVKCQILHFGLFRFQNSLLTAFKYFIGTRFCNHYSFNSFHPNGMPFGILDRSEVFYCPKKNQKQKINFGLFWNQESDPSRSKTKTQFQRSRGIRAGWRASDDQESLETTLFQRYFMLRYEKLQWIGRICTFQRLVYNKIGQLLAVAEL